MANKSLAAARARAIPPASVTGAAGIELTRGFVTLVDGDDLEWLSRYCWQATFRRRDVRAMRKAGAGAGIFMHREILRAEPGVFVDHINGDTLDNRRANLRLCTIAENNRNVRLRADNRAGIKGVRQDKTGWMARIQVDGVSHYLGHFGTAEEAGRAYDRAGRQFHGAFARPNFPEEGVA